MKPTQDRMLEILDLVWKDVYQEELQSIRDLIVEHFALREKVGEWQKRAVNLTLPLYVNNEWWIAYYEFAKEIRDFGFPNGKE
jgi:hypothetical protein